MRNILLLSGLLIAGIAVYIVVFFNRTATSLSPDEVEFAISDANEVERILLSRYVRDTVREQVDLVKEGDEWRLNNQYPALQPRVDHLLSVMGRLSVREVLNEAGEATANRFFEVLHTRVQAFDGRGNLLKDYQISSETPDARGTLMRMTGVETPFVVELPGLQGYVKASFPIESNVWRANRLFLADTAKLQGLSIAFARSSESWVLVLDSAGTWRLRDAVAVPERLQDLLSTFKGMVYAETFAEADFPGQKTRLEGQQPDVRIIAQYRDGHQREIVLYDRSENPNNLFGWVVDEEELLTIQHFVIDPFLLSSRYLTGESDNRLPPLEETKELPKAEP